MEEMKWSSRVSLNISSETLSTDEMASALGLCPGEASAHTYPANHLLIHAEAADGCELEDQLYAIAETANRLSGAVRTRSGQIEMNICCNVSSPGDWIGIVLSPDVLKTIADVGLPVGFVFTAIRPSNGAIGDPDA